MIVVSPDHTHYFSTEISIWTPPLPWKKLDPLENVGPPLKPWKIKVFFEITIGHSLYNKLRSTKKNKKRKSGFLTVRHGPRSKIRPKNGFSVMSHS